MADVGFWMSDFRWRILDVGCGMSDFGCRMWDVGFRMSDVGFRKLVEKRQEVEADYIFSNHF